MSFEAYIVAEFDSGLVCLTTNRPGAYTVGGVEYLFTDNLQDITLPNREVDVLSNTIANQQVSFSYFDTSATPGRSMQTGTRNQGADVSVYLLDVSGVEIIAFNGEVTAFEFALEERAVKVQAGAKTQTAMVEFPRGSTLEDGRFIRRRTLDVQSVDQNQYNQGIQYLAYLMEFQSNYGSPTNPGALTVFIKDLFQVTSSTQIEPNDAYMFFDDSASDLAVPVIYGANEQVPLNVLGHYRISIGGGYFKIFILIIASHDVIGDPELAASTDFSVRIYQAGVSVGVGNGYFSSDRLNQPVSYATFAVQYTSSTFEEPTTASIPDFDVANCYIPRLHGKKKPGGSLLNGLGDMLQDIWLTYGGGDASQIDWTTVSSSREDLNGFEVSAVFNDKQENQTIERILSSRIQQQFPIAFGYPFGRLAWQSLTLREDGQTVGEVRYGVNAFSRGDIRETGRDQIVNDLKVSFGINGNSGHESASVIFSRENFELSRASYDRWGKRPASSLSVQDTRSASTAYKVGADYLKKRAGIRMSASYSSDDLSLTTLPFMSILSVTDEDAGFDEEPFYFLGVKWLSDLTGFTVDLLSVKMI